MRDNWCKDFEVGCPSYQKSLLKTSNGPHPFFKHKKTPEKRVITAFYVCSQTSVS